MSGWKDVTAGALTIVFGFYLYNVLDRGVETRDHSFGTLLSNLRILDGRACHQCHNGHTRSWRQ
jgi:hypothetical protein